MSQSSEPSSRMSTSIPFRIVNPSSSSPSFLLSSATTSSCCSRRSRDSPFATVSRGEWSVSAMYLCPSAVRRPRHLLDRAAAVGPLRVQVQIGLQLRAHRRTGRGQRARGLLQLDQVRRGRAVHRLEDDGLGLRPDPRQLGQRPGPAAGPHLGRRQRRDRVGRPPVSLHPMRRLPVALQVVPDRPQRLHRLRHTRLVTHPPIMTPPRTTAAHPHRARQATLQPSCRTVGLPANPACSATSRRYASRTNSLKASTSCTPTPSTSKSIAMAKYL